MPSHLIHTKWCKRLLGFIKPEIDKFLDDFIKEIDIETLKDCIGKCREFIQRFSIDEIESLLNYYTDKLGIDIKRYSLGLIFYTHLDLDMQIKLAKINMKSHDSWRFFDYCVVIEYIERKFGPEGVKVAIIHMILDEIARLSHIDYVDARKGAEAILSCMLTLQKDYIIDTIHKVLNKLDEIIIDVSFSVGENFINRKIRRITAILNDNTDIESTLNNIARRSNAMLEIISIDRIDYSTAYSLYMKIRSVCNRLKIKTRLMFDKLTGKIVSESPLILVQYSNNREVVYPHSVTVYPVGEVYISVRDLILVTDRVAGVMRPGSMRDDCKGGH